MTEQCIAPTEKSLADRPGETVIEKLLNSAVIAEEGLTDEMLDVLDGLHTDATEGDWFTMRPGKHAHPNNGPARVYAPGDELRFVANCADGMNMRATPNTNNALLIAAMRNMLGPMLKELREHRARQVADAIPK